MKYYKACSVLLVFIMVVTTLFLIGCDSNEDLPHKPEELEETVGPEQQSDPEPEPISEDENDEQISEPAPEKKVVVDVDVLRLRSGPSTDHDILDRLILDTVLRVIGEQNDWLEVITPDGKEGWVHGDYVISHDSKESRDEDKQTREPYGAHEFGLESIGLSSGMTIEEVENILGEPRNFERLENGIQGPMTIITYEGLELGFYDIPDSTDRMLGFYTLSTPEIICKRSIRVGDTAESVMGKYFNEHEEKMADIAETQEYVELYYIDLADGTAKSGFYLYDHNTNDIIRIQYWYGIPQSDQATMVIFSIENGLVKQIARY